MSMKDPAEMTDEELEAAEIAATGAAPGPDAETTTEEETTTETTTEGTGTAASTEQQQEQSTSTESTEQTGQAGEEATTTTTGEAAAQSSAGAETAKVAGVASKDGTRVLPYSALQAERRSARAAAARAERAEREAETLRKEVEDLRAGRTKESTELTEEEVQRMEADYPEEGKKLRAAFERTKELERQIAEARPPKEAHEDDVGDDPTQEAIDQVPLLVEWQHDAAHADKWQRAIAVDNLLKDSPKWKDKPAVQRFERVAEMVAEEFDIEVPGPKKPEQTSASSTTPKPPSKDPKKVIEKADRQPPSTLSDLKGGSVPDHGELDLKRMPPTRMLNKFMDMDPADIDRHLEKLG